MSDRVYPHEAWCAGIGGGLCSCESPEHEPQHPDSPTWCIHCGAFDVYFERVKCSGDRSGKYNSREDANFKRMAESVGLSEPKEKE